MKNDGSLQLRGGVTPLMELFLARRSVRKYSPEPATAEDAEYVLGSARRFAERVGFVAPRLVAVERGPDFDRVVRAAMGGLVGKINPWLAFTRAGHLLLCGAIYPLNGQEAGVERAVKEASMAMQVALLAATQRGLGTCWMAGIHHGKVEEAHPLPDGAHLVAISPLGRPPERMGISWDTVAYHLVSKRRKPLANLWMEGRWRHEP